MTTNFVDELQAKIARVKKALSVADNSSQEYFTYSDILRELEKQLPKNPIKLHVETGPTCEGCQ